MVPSQDYVATLFIATELATIRSTTACSASTGAAPLTAGSPPSLWYCRSNEHYHDRVMTVAYLLDRCPLGHASQGGDGNHLSADHSPHPFFHAFQLWRRDTDDEQALARVVDAVTANRLANLQETQSEARRMLYKCRSTLLLGLSAQSISECTVFVLRPPCSSASIA